jgi:hypothetical protein
MTPAKSRAGSSAKSVVGQPRSRAERYAYVPKMGHDDIEPTEGERIDAMELRQRRASHRGRAVGATPRPAEPRLPGALRGNAAHA